MNSPRLPALFLATLFLAVAAVQAQQASCHAAARECEQQIRQMLAGRRYLGIQVVELKPGLVVKTVIPDSPAERAMLQAGDRIFAVNGRALHLASSKEFKQVLAEASDTGKLWMIVQRRGGLKKLEARLEPYPNEYVEKVIAGHLSKSHTATAGAQR